MAFFTRILALSGIVALALAADRTACGEDPKQPEPPTPAVKNRKTDTPFVFPCDDYLKGLKGKGNFGILIGKSQSSAFGGTYHLAEDVWLQGGKEVRAVADGVVVYSDFSETWTDDKGRKHWNLGNVILVEHRLEPAEGDVEYVCSLYVHLGADRKVKTGDAVTRGQPIGSIGADKSAENGEYPAHLHFGIHKGPYFQIPPSWKKEVEEAARKDGLPVPPVIRDAAGNPVTPPGPLKPEMVKGEVESFDLLDGGSVRVTLKDGGGAAVFSLLVGSSSPNYRSVPIMCWSSGYGSKTALAEWVRPSEWIAKHPVKDKGGK